MEIRRQSGLIAVLGATGKAGRAAIRELRNGGTRVRAVVRDPSKAEDLAALGCEIAVANLRDADAVKAALAGAQAVQVLCPVNPRAENAAADMEAMIATIGEALTAVRPDVVVAISDYGAEVNEGAGVTLLFHRLEATLREIPASLTFLRSAEHMQNWTRYRKFVAETGVLPTLHHPVTKVFPTVSAMDVGVIAAELLLAPNESAKPRIVYAEGPRRYTALDVAAAFQDVLGRDVMARENPRSEWVPSLLRGGLSASYAALVAELFDAHNAGRIDVEPGVGELRHGSTELRDIIASL